MTPVTIIHTPFPNSIAIENVPKVDRRFRATNTRAKSIAIDTLATNAVMMVRMRVKIEKAWEARNREDMTERNAKPATTGWRTRTTIRASSMTVTVSGETPASLKSRKEDTL